MSHFTSSGSGNKDSNSVKETIVFFTNRLITVVALIYLIFIPFGKISTNNRLTLNEFSIALILLVANSDLMQRMRSMKLTKDGVEFSIEEVKQVVDSKISEVNRKDHEAIKAVGLQLSKSMPRVSKEELCEKISQSSLTTADIIFTLAKSTRNSAKLERESLPDFELIERTIPIFEALVHFKYQSGNKCHRIYSQLVYALKDQKEPDWKRAAESLDQAIKHYSQSPLPALYCFNWLICIAELKQQQYSIQEQTEIRDRFNALTDESGNKSESVFRKQLLESLKENKAFQAWYKQHYQILQARN